MSNISKSIRQLIEERDEVKREFQKLSDILARHQKFVLTTHVNPDPDAIGSEIAFAEYLRSLGKTVQVLNSDSTPLDMTFLDPRSTIEYFDESKHATDIRKADIIVLLDAAEPNRMARMEQSVMRSPAMKICIDHHRESKPFAAFYLMDDDASATGELLYRFFIHVGYVNFPNTAATALYAAIMSDLGSFRFPRTDSGVHLMIADLIAQGVDPVDVYDRLYEQGPIGRLRLLGMVLAGIQLIHDGTVAYAIMTQNMFQETQTSEADTENMVNYLLRIKNVRIAILITELTDQIKISFRSKGSIPINELAKEFGGNGHLNAAGARVPGKLITETTNDIIKLSQKYIL
jgi:phosphoesterase RecJ-like protein